MKNKMILDPYCFKCKHYLGDLSCKAFPKEDSIPMEILDGSFDHANPWPRGDNGFRFEPIEEEQED